MEANKKINHIIKEMCEQNIIAQDAGYGPFCAAISDKDDNIISIAHNSVIVENSSVCHAEINAIKQIQVQYNTYDLSSYDLSICITAEPCIMCIGAIMWSGIKRVYYGMSSKEVEKISGFIEGYKPDWENYFQKIGIDVVGGIEVDDCKKALENYVKKNNPIYKPKTLS
ncbi:MAG: nucleoside deaminase [bacterium]|nr:nucleoside deaminase [bacterium]